MVAAGRLEIIVWFRTVVSVEEEYNIAIDLTYSAKVELARPCLRHIELMADNVPFALYLFEARMLVDPLFDGTNAVYPLYKHNQVRQQVVAGSDAQVVQGGSQVIAAD